METVSVIVPTYNRGTLLAPTLDSLLRQTHPVHQLIVVNDGCTDGTDALLAGYAHHPAVSVMRTTGQLGKPAAVNVALPVVTGEFVWVFDDDDVALPDGVERHVRAFDRDAAAGFSYAPCDYVDTLPDGALGTVTRSAHVPEFGELGLLGRLLEMNFLGGAMLFLRTSAHRAIGGYDVRLVRSQDYDIAIRAARRFRGVRVDGGATFLYRQHAGTRGSAMDAHSPTDRGRRWLHYDQQIFRGLRDTLILDEYLPPAPDGSITPRTQVLQRALVMVLRNLFEEALEDVGTAFADRPHAPVTALERRILLQVMTRAPWYGSGVLDHPPTRSALAALLRRAPAWRTALYGDLYREIRATLTSGETVHGRRERLVLLLRAFRHTLAPSPVANA